MTGTPPRWLFGLSILLALLLLPVATIAVLALRGDGTLAHLWSTVLPASVRDTLLLVCGVVAVTVCTGAGAAWLTTMYRFPGRAMLDRMLLLPLAIPAYILAFAYVELLDFAGPMQSSLRALFGWKSAQDYAFPDIRSLSGAVFVLSCALYPYVYLSARASFVQQSACVLEVARTLGCTSLGAFRQVALPLARPALVAGAALVAMETLNEFGALQYLGVQTLSVAVYVTWLQRGSLGGAAQIALTLLVFVFALLLVERHARRHQRYHHTTGRMRALPFQQLDGAKAVAAFGLCLLPVVLGFALPVLMLAQRAVLHLELALDAGFWRAVWTSLWLAALAAAVTVLAAVVLAYARRTLASPLVRAATTLASLGYALPGTVLALGLLLPLAAFDNQIALLVQATVGGSPGLLISGSIAILLLSYVIRFLAVALGSIEEGLGRLSPNLDAAGRALGYSPSWVLRLVHLPLLKPALGAAALLVFVDTMKELPATLLLRPLNFETLATHVYSLAALERFEAAALGALAIVAAGLLPVLMLHRAIAGGRRGGSGG
jgi:iron(III) transport system permease protein